MWIQTHDQQTFNAADVLATAPPWLGILCRSFVFTRSWVRIPAMKSGSQVDIFRDLYGIIA